MSAAPRQITSTKNPLVQRFRAAAAGELDGVLLAEGVRLVGEAVAAKARVLQAAMSPRCADAKLRHALQAATPECYECSDDVLAALSALDTPQGVAALIERPRADEAALLRAGRVPLVVCAAGVRDPGNLGSVLRTAEAAGATGVITL